MASAADVLTAIGAAFNNVWFLSQMPLMLQLMREGDSDKYPFLPSLSMMMLLSLWCGYTVWVIPTPQLYIANFPGMIVPFLNLIVFTIYASSWRRRLLIACSTLVALGASWGFSAAVFLSSKGGGSDASGAIIVVLSVFLWVSPMPSLYSAMVDADLSRVPALLSVAQIVQGSIWIAAGVTLNDRFIMGCNVGGVLSACLQLGVYLFIRWRIASSPSATKENPVDDSAALVTVSIFSGPDAAPTPSVGEIAASLDISLATPMDAVGGHVGCLSVKDAEGTAYFLKPQLGDERGVREAFFYSHLAAGSSLARWVPRYFGVLADARSNPPQSLLVLEDVTAPFKQPCVLDVKMGTRATGPNADASKVLAEALKWPPMETLGLRLVGSRHWAPRGPNACTWRVRGKDFARSLTVDSFPTAIADFLSDGDAPRAGLAAALHERLVALRALFATQTEFQFFGSSLLLVYEGNETTGDVPRFDVRMIDFAHVEEAAHKAPLKLDEGYIRGLDTLCSILGEISRR